MSQLTKRAITESFMKLINQVPFDKITVKDIVEDCGVNRNTFYYHYSDIYALLDEILENETKRVLVENPSESSWRDAIMEACSFALKNKKGVYHIYNSLSRRKIDAYLYQVMGSIMYDFVKKQAEGLQVKDEDLHLIADFYKCAFVGLILQWLDSGMKQNPEYIVDKIFFYLGGSTRNMLKNAAEKSNRK